ncbi:HEAT repeat domain-containing protein [Flavobacterium faecale]|uniref:HEAT repeat domain-containing protein n=1 Tax=Flavobacterium faecale TaxID=1355330 RepID=UPI003AADBB19
MVNLTQYFIEYLKHAPIIIQLTWSLSAAFLLTIALLITYLKYLRARLRSKERIEATYQKKYESDLIEYLYAGNEEEDTSIEQQKIIDYLKKCGKSSLKRKIIISTLLKLRNEISGETADAIQKLYYKTEFISQATAKLKSKKWDVIARAIKELAQFEIKEVHDDIIVHINHPKKEVRREIQFYLVKLFSFEGLGFLDVLENQLSEWDQIQLLEILQKIDNHKLPDISDWLQSSNYSVISFALKLAKIYNQFEAKEELLELLNHPSEAIRIEAIEIVSHLGIFEAVTLLKDNIEDRSLEEQISFFKIEEAFLMTLEESFLMQYVYHENFEIKNAAKKIIRLIDINAANTINIDRIQNDNLEVSNLIKAS